MIALVLPLLAAGEIASMAGPLAKAGGGVAESVAKAYSARQVALATIEAAKHDARAKIQAAIAMGEAQRATKSIDEASEVMSVMDRPCLRIHGDIAPGLHCELDLSILSIFGFMAAWDVAGQYNQLQRMDPTRYADAVQCTSIIQGILGYAPIDPRAASVLANAFQESTAQGQTVTQVENPLPPRTVYSESNIQIPKVIDPFGVQSKVLNWLFG